MLQRLYLALAGANGLATVGDISLTNRGAYASDAASILLALLLWWLARSYPAGSGGDGAR